MKKIIIPALILSSTLTFAQEKDTINSHKIDEVIINKVIKKESESTSKMPLKAIEDPQVYSSISNVVLQNQLLSTVDDAFRNFTGVQKMWSANGRAGDGGSYVSLRGFISENSMRNGMIAPVSTAMDAINIEKIEVLKGPSATLFGSNVTSYGGLINRVTKRPFDYLKGEISLSGGSYNYYRAQADINTPVTNDKRLMFRVNSAYTTSGSFQDSHAKNTYFAFAPSLRYKIDDKLDINVEFENFESRATPEQVIFYLNSSIAPGIKDLENLGLNYKNSYIASGIYTTAKVRNLFGQINAKINDHIKSSTNVATSYSYSDGQNPYFYITPKSALDNELGVVRADQSTHNSVRKYFQVQQNFNLDFNIGNVRNRTVIGGDYMTRKDDQHFIFLSAFDWVPFRGGVYDNMTSAAISQMYSTLQNTPGYDFTANNTYTATGTLNTYSSYVANVVTPITGLNIMTSVRYENNKYDGGLQGTVQVAPYSQGSWSPKLGVVYEIIKDKFSVFGNYQNSFKSNGYINIDTALNTALSKPETANQWEGGFKTSIVKDKINATISYYNIDVKNSLLTTGYVGAMAIQNQAGALTSKGVELEVNAYLIKGFSLIGGISYNNMKYTKMDADSQGLIGLRPDTASSPWLANFNASYQFVDGNLKGLGFGIGGNYASENRISNTPQGYFALPKYFVLNANAFYDTKKFRIGIKADNFTNEHYWNGYTTANPQQLLNVVGSFTYKL
ncbi:TonB-dependent receptor [Soonwooa sp.]|uniref:TonB-dependent siderophore receptor n=1 Tax=Soonwooa sp. TaxID=1938592 RepID=UPI0026059D68|nr:TonB-dependent receptor [Soonwooa sp.]